MHVLLKFQLTIDSFALITLSPVAVLFDQFLSFCIHSTLFFDLILIQVCSQSLFRIPICNASWY